MASVDESFGAAKRGGSGIVGYYPGPTAEDMLFGGSTMPSSTSACALYCMVVGKSY